MSADVRLGSWERQQRDARPVRSEVFLVEQQVPIDMEWDEMDALCIHAVAYDSSGTAVGTGRLLPDGHIGRMAVLKPVRGSGIGGAILVALMEEARRRGDPAVLLNAQTRAEAFYRRYGFEREGDEFMEAGIPHIRMRHVFT